MKGVQKEREEKLARILKDFLQQYVRGGRVEFIRHVESEAERLSQAGQQLTTLVLLLVIALNFTSCQFNLQYALPEYTNFISLTFGSIELFIDFTYLC